MITLKNDKEIALLDLASRIVLEGDVADPSNPPTGCHFHPRCRYATERCKVETPPMGEIAAGHAVRCLRAEEITVKGVG